jgi:hypothetical protein
MIEGLKNGKIDVCYNDICKTRLSDNCKDIALSLVLYNDKNSFLLEGDKILAYYFVKRRLDDYLRFKGECISHFSIDSNFALNSYDIEYIRADDIDSYCLDFHVDKALTGIIKNYLTLDIDTDFIKSTIWYMSSRINYRSHYDYYLDKPIDYGEYEGSIVDKYGALWLQIKDTFYSIAKIRITLLK